MFGPLQAELNTGIDAYAGLAPGEWRGWVQRAPPGRNTRELHNMFEAGPAFEAIIDHPAWWSHMQRYAGSDALFLDENFATITPGATGEDPQAGATGLHSGAHKRRVRTQFRYHDGEFRCGQLNILIALTDIAHGDGATMVVPGSHKSNLVHPALQAGTPEAEAVRDDGSAALAAEAVEVHLDAGDALLFVDCMLHGSARRTNPGERRVFITRYGVPDFRNRYGYGTSPELLERLTERRRQTLEPKAPLVPPDAEQQRATQLSSAKL
jgi:hypothetical protein